MSEGMIVRLALDSSNFQSGLAGASQRVKQAKNEFQSISKVIGRNINDLNQLRSKYDALAKVISAQEQKVSMLKKAYEKQREAVEGNANATAKEKKALQTAAQAYNRAAGDLGKYKLQLDGLVNSMDKVEKEAKQVNLNNISKQFDAIKSDLNSLTKVIPNTIGKIGTGLESIGSKTESLGKTLTKAVSLPLAAGFTKAAQESIKFSDEMTTLKAVSGATAKELEAMKQKSSELAVKYGEDTSKINAGLTELTKSGFKIKDSMKITEAVILGAKASGEDFNAVLSATVGTMKTFNYGADDAKTVLSKLVAVGNASSTGVEELGEGLAKVGSTAKVSKIPLDSIASALGVLRDRNVDVSTAATSLKSGLSNIATAAKDMVDGGKISAATQAFKDMGVDLKDVYKNGVSLPKLLKDMSKGTANMTTEQRKAAVSAAFGKESMAAWIALMDDKAIGSLEEYTKASENSSKSLDELWKKMQKSPQVQIDKTKASFASLGRTIGDEVVPVVLPMVRDVTDAVNTATKAFGKLSDSQKENIVKFGGIAIATGPALIALGKVTKSVGGMFDTFSKAPVKFGLLGAGVGLITTAMAENGVTIKDVQKTITDAWTTITDSFEKSGILKSFDKLSESIGNLFSSKDEDSKGNKLDKVGKSAQENNPALKNFADITFKLVDKGIKGLTTLTDALNKLPQGVKEGFGKFAIGAAILVPIGTKIFKVTKKVWDFTKSVKDIGKAGLEFIGFRKQVSDTKEKVDDLGDKGSTAKRKLSKLGSKFDTSEFNSSAKKLNDKIDKIDSNAQEAVESINDIGSAASSVSDDGSSYPTRSERHKNKKTKDKKSKSKGKSSKGKGLSGLVSGFVDVTEAASDTKDMIEKVGPATKGLGSKTALEPVEKMTGKFGGLLAKVGSKAAGKLAGKGLIGGLGSLATKFLGLSNPIGIAVTATTTAIDVFQLAYDNSETFRNGVDKLSSTVSKTFTNAMNDANTVCGETWSGIKKGFNEGIDDVKKNVEESDIAGSFQSAFNLVNKVKDGFVDGFETGIAKMLGTTKKGVEESDIWQGFKKAFGTVYRHSMGPLNALIDGANSILKLFGSSKKDMKHVALKYKSGTNGHPGGPAIVNDELGPTYREAVQLPSGQTFIPEGRNVLFSNLPAGSKVLPAKQTAKVFKYKSGIGDFFEDVKDVGKKVVRKASDIFGDVMDYIDNPKKLVNKAVDTFVSFAGLNGFEFDSSKASVKLATQALVDKVKSLFDEMSAESGMYGDLGSNDWFKIDGNWVREWQYRLLEPIITQYHFMVTDGGRRTWDNYDHSKGRAMDIAIPGNPLGIYWKVAQQIDKMPFVKYVNSNMKSTISGHWAPSNLEPSPNHIHISFTKELLSKKELHGGGGGSYAGKGSIPNPKGSGVDRWIPMIKETARRMGVRLTSSGLNAVLRRIRQESNGDPYVTNNWDSNAQAGHPSKGLLQYIQPTLNSWVPKGVKPVLTSGYAQLMALFNDSNWLADISRPGGWGPTGHKRFEKGGLVTRHTIAEIGEGNKPEMIIPLTNKTRSVQLINKAKKLIGMDDEQSSIKVDGYLSQQVELLQQQNDQLSALIELMSALLNKDMSIYMDGKNIAKMQAKNNVEAANSYRKNLNRMRGVVN